MDAGKGGELPRWAASARIRVRAPSAGSIDLPRWLYYAAIYGTALVLFVGLRYPVRSWGLSWPSLA
jgi:hypothetical protein